MSITVIKKGLLDTIQDSGRFGYQHFGINTGGVMDPYAHQLANALLGKTLHAPVIEVHFPAACFYFNDVNIITITGANFSPILNNNPVPLNQPLIVNSNTELRFSKPMQGARCYISTLPELEADNWLNSYSTNLHVGAGGYYGRALKKGDVLTFKIPAALKDFISRETHIALPWKGQEIKYDNEISVLKGNEWHLLKQSCKDLFLAEPFKLTIQSDRMGYRLHGPALAAKENSMISSAVTFGTIQLLPGGQIIILMAEHQTTGGYPRIAQVCSASLPRLAQLTVGRMVNFKIVSNQEAENQMLGSEMALMKLQRTAAANIKKLLHV